MGDLLVKKKESNIVKRMCDPCRIEGFIVVWFL